MKEETKQETQGYICPQTKKQCHDECCVSAEDCHIEAGFGIVSDCEPPKEDALEEAAENYTEFWLQNKGLLIRDAFIEGAKWQQEQDKNKYSEEEVEIIIQKLMNDIHCGDLCYGDNVIDFKMSPKQWFKQFNNK
jgi:hypothetical protein